jgi:hypothetical protein
LNNEGWGRYSGVSPQAIRGDQHRAAVAAAKGRTAYRLAAYTASGTAGGYFTERGLQALGGQLSDVTWEDFVPGFATRKAYRQMNAACGS